ncbi:hypothetical protein N7489_009951 [Penicillium chrysogenum]|uniref:Uncharacterized protein n=1 Tax=Penicillium chrysogenum TaxID=5076 RepID=A0ABQ8WVA3_PENCH|nr:uncharacterized protein N7489_009951 [Penicillium chrysogenum]KAJ5229243.1 hypothetical protein N7489_009951 [Penicillium chrysogenum]KAJ5282878.1 hypothetical protein N7505_000858 [Penicillium chrysogenum]KAJ6169118.1 hypothetical protein N7497_001961 [Penicillium chrysogenum]
MKTARVSPAPINPDTGSKATVKDAASSGHGLTGPSRQQHKAPPSQPSESKLVRLKLTKPRPPKSNPQEVDWDEDLRPTPNEIAENKGTRGGTSVVDTDPNRPKTVAKNTGSKRTIPSKPQTAPAKRRKSNTKKSTATKEGSTRGPQLPLVTLTASILPPAVPLGNSEPPDTGPLDGQNKDHVTKPNENAPEAPHQPSPLTEGHNKRGNTRAGGVVVEIRSCTSVTTGSSSDFEDYGQRPSRTSKVSILEHRAQSNRQTSKDETVHMMPGVSSSSDVDLKGPSHTTTSKVTIRESRALSKKQNSQTKTVHEKSHRKHRGRAESVGNKLVLALHGAEPSQNEPVNNQAAPLVISSDPVQYEESPQKQFHKMPTDTVLEPPKIENVLDGTIPVEMHQNQNEPETVNPALIAKKLPPKEEEIEEADDAGFWRLLGDDRMSTASSSDFETGRGLLGDGPSILDYHMGMEHIPGFATLQPIRSAPTTSSHGTNMCESQADSSLETSNVGKFDELIAGRIEGRGSHTPESQKPLLTKESLMELDSASPQLPKSVPKTSIVDSNGSPRLIPQSAKSMVAPQFDLDDEKSHEETTSDSDASPSEYDRKSCSISTESRYDRLMWTKFKRDMFLEYGIQTEKLARSHPWPPPKKHRPSFSQKDTAEAAKSEKASTIEASSSQRTIDERALGGAPSKSHEYLDQSFRTDISVSTQPAAKSHRTSTMGGHDDMEWISTLQVAQKDAHHLLQQTNSHLSTQLAAEKATVSRVLEIYREGCSRILDDLFQAQEARMQLYRQQMQSVKEQHADICQDLVRGLQELDRRVQQGPI